MLTCCIMMLFWNDIFNVYTPLHRQCGLWCCIYLVDTSYSVLTTSDIVDVLHYDAVLKWHILFLNTVTQTVCIMLLYLPCWHIIFCVYHIWHCWHVVSKCLPCWHIVLCVNHTLHCWYAVSQCLPCWPIVLCVAFRT